MKEKRKSKSNPYNRKIVIVLMGLALLIVVFVAGLILGGNNDAPNNTTQLQATVITATPITSDSNTVDLPELQTQWAELGITKTAVTEIRATPTPE